MKTLKLVLVLLVAALTTSAMAGDRVIPLRYSLEVEVIEPDGAQALKDAGTFDSVRQAVAEGERINREGLCLLIEESTELAAVCYPSSRLVRVRIVKVW
jgi:hypothetical protein